jgi:hypothetical protein
LPLLAASLLVCSLLRPGFVAAQPRHIPAAPPQFEPVPPPPPLPPKKRLHWVGEADAAGSADAERPPRMSREERRKLRREIHDAGREIYPHRHPPRDSE